MYTEAGLGAHSLFKVACESCEVGALVLTSSQLGSWGHRNKGPQTGQLKAIGMYDQFWARIQAQTCLFSYEDTSHGSGASSNMLSFQAP